MAIVDADRAAEIARDIETEIYHSPAEDRLIGKRLVHEHDLIRMDELIAEWQEAQDECRACTFDEKKYGDWSHKRNMAGAALVGLCAAIVKNAEDAI